MILDGVIALLKGSSTVAAQTGDSIYKNSLPRKYSFPAVAVHRYGGTQEYDFNGPVGIREDQIQLDVYGHNADECQATAEAIRNVLVPFVGTLPDGSVVQACFLERDIDLPFLPNSDTKGIADRAVLGFRVVSART